MDYGRQASAVLAKVQKYRGLARTLTDNPAAKRILDYTAELEGEAVNLIERLHVERIRTRAHQLWREHNCPPGRDEEFWLRAEQELGKARGAAGRQD